MAVSQSCTGQYTRKLDAENLLLQLSEGLEGIRELQALIEADSSTIQVVCGVTAQRLAELNSVMNDATNAFTEFVGITEKAVDILECERINNIFVDFYHEALCTNIPYSLMWIFSTMMAVYILGMLIVVFRGAMLPTEEAYNETKGMVYDEEDSYYNNKKDNHVSEYQVNNHAVRVASETDEASNTQDDNHVNTTTIEYSDATSSRIQGYDFDNNPVVNERRYD